MSAAPAPRVPWAWLALAAVATLAALLWLGYPGFLSSDAQAQYAQALSGSYDNVHPPLMAWLWRQVARAWPGSGGIYALFLALYAGGLAALLATGIASTWKRTLAWLAIAAWPPLLVVLCHLWKDVGFAAALLLAAGLASAWRLRGSQPARIAAIALLLLAVAFRHNGWPAVLPFAWVLATPAPRRRAMLAFVAIAVLLAVFPALVERALGARHRTIWPAIALWDLAGVSLDAREQLLPRSVVAPELDVPTLEKWYSPWSNPSLFGSNLVLLGFYNDYTPAQLADVRNAWLRAVRDHPGAYLGHRARMTRWQLAGFPADLPSGLVYAAEYRVPEGVAPIAPPPRPARDALVAWTEAHRGGPWFWGGAYLALALLVLALPRTRRAAGGMAGVLASSSLLYAAPLPLLAPGAEWRYVFWSALAALLAAALAGGELSSRRRV